MSRSVSFIKELAPHTLADQIANLWTRWDMGREVWKKRYAEVIQYVYATSTRETTNNQNPWSHSTHIPKLTQIHDNLGANYASALFGQKDWFQFDPGDEKAQDIKLRRKIEAYIETKHRISEAAAAFRAALNDWATAGNCFLHVKYVDERVMQKDGTMVSTYTGPKLYRISPYDIVFDFTAESFRDAAKVVRRVVSMGEFLKQAKVEEGYDPAVVEMTKEFRLSCGLAKAGDVRKNIQRAYDGFSDAYAYFTSGMVETLTFYGDIYDPQTLTLHEAQEITIVDRRWVLCRKRIDSIDGRPHIFHSGWRKRPDNLWGMGPLDNLVGMQYLIDHLENAKADAFDKMISPDRVFVGNVEEEELENGVTYYHIDDGQGSVQNLGPDPSVLNAEMQIQYKEAQMEAYAGAPREAMGIRTPGEKTMFEVQSLNNAASRLFDHKILDFQREIIEPVINAELELAREFINMADMARVFDEADGLTEFMSISKEDLKQSGSLRAVGASHYAVRSKLVQELAQFQSIIANDPEMKLHFPAKVRAKVLEQVLGFDRYGLYVEFGGIAEALEAQQRQSAAAAVTDEDQAVMMEDGQE